jgi:D-alanyl-D-alanine carboxypeptidase
LSEFTEGSKVFRLHPDALEAWRKMKEHAKMDGIDLELVSAFRSKERQQEIIDRKLGERLDQVYSVNCPAGYSEHHTGRAIDLGTLGTEVADLGVSEPKANFYGSVISISAHLPSAIRKKLYSFVERCIKPGGIILLEAFSRILIC